METPKYKTTVSPSRFSDESIAPRKKKNSCKINTTSTSLIFPKYLVVRSLFNTSSTLDRVAMPWISVAFQPLDISGFLDALLKFLDKHEKWIPKFNGIDTIIVENHMH